jgi:hypothetical protein
MDISLLIGLGTNKLRVRLLALSYLMWEQNNLSEDEINALIFDFADTIYALSVLNNSNSSENFHINILKILNINDL